MAMPPQSHFLLLLLLLCCVLLPFSAARTHPSDIQSLSLFKLSIHPSSIPPSSCLSSWAFSPDLDPCDSAFSSSLFTCGLRCDLVQPNDNLSRVTDISLDPAGYSGPLSPSVWSLPFLLNLDLADNNFSGPLPPPPPSPSRLTRLTLSRNFFSGEIPDLSPLRDSLSEAYLDGNFFSGGIAGLASMSQLQRLELQANNLTGELPADLGSLNQLRYLDASGNLLTGGFPTELPASLIEISLRNNRIQGGLPGSAVARLPNMQVMDLSSNMLSGGVPREIFQHPALEQVTLAGNEFRWIERPWDGGAGSQLVAVDLGHNGLTGLLPGFIGSMPRLSAVDLRDNEFTGMIPVDYALRAMGAEEGMAQFGRLILAGNYLFGPIPGPMGEMKEGTATVSLKDNCLFRCPVVFFFCEDGQQKPSDTCREFNPVIP